MATTVVAELANPPLDAISCVQFSPSGRSLLVGAWDNAIRVYQFNEETKEYMLHSTKTCEAPILDVCWGSDESTFFAVGLRQDVTLYQSEDEPILLSSHDQATNKVAYSTEHNILLSTSWDSTLHVHDPPSRRYIRITLAAKPFAMALTKDRAVVAMADRKVSVYELNALRELVEQAGETADGRQPLTVEPWQQRESSLKFMTRAVACMPDGTGFATSSIEGRVSVDRFDPELEKQAYAFKCHREKSTMAALGEQEADGQTGEPVEVDVVYPVNSLAFHPAFGTFATGGGEGVVALWDAHTKRRIRTYPKLTASVAAMDFSPDGKYLAIGVSPGFEDGKEDEEPQPELVKIYLRELGSNEAKGKPAKEKA